MITVKLTIGISYYNDAECLKRCLKSINSPFVHRVIAVDGKYKGFGKTRGSPKLSDDGSREILAEWGDKHTGKLAMAYCAGVPEFSKRQMYVDVATWCEADFLLILDSDEYLVVQWRVFMKDLAWIKESRQQRGTIGTVTMLDQDQSDYLADRPRLLYRPEQFFYDGKHNQIALRDRLQPMLDRFSMERQIIEIVHCKQGCRSQFRQEQQKDYEYRLEMLEREP